MSGTAGPTGEEIHGVREPAANEVLICCEGGFMGNSRELHAAQMGRA